MVDDFLYICQGHKDGDWLKPSYHGDHNRTILIERKANINDLYR